MWGCRAERRWCWALSRSARPRRGRGDWANLLDNAARYADTSIGTHLIRDHDHVIVHVDDDGQDVPLADRARIFERFARIDDGRARDDGGSGLGLAVVRSIVERADGTIACSTGPRGGARFTLTLPAATPAGATTQPATSATVTSV